MSTLLASLQRELLEMKSKTTFPGKYAFFRWSLRRCRHQIHVPSCWRQERDACGNRPRTLARSSWQSTVMQPGRKRAFCQSLTVLQCKRICGDAFDVPVSFRWALHAIVDARARIRNLAPVSKWLISPLSKVVPLPNGLTGWWMEVIPTTEASPGMILHSPAP